MDILSTCNVLVPDPDFGLWEPLAIFHIALWINTSTCASHYKNLDETSSKQNKIRCDRLLSAKYLILQFMPMWMRWLHPTIHSCKFVIHMKAASTRFKLKGALLQKTLHTHIRLRSDWHIWRHQRKGAFLRNKLCRPWSDENNRI